MDSDFMNTVAGRISAAGIQVIRFEFEYMAKRRRDSQRRGPDRAAKLIARFHEVLGRVGPAREVVIGGKSMGGRVASMIADEVRPAGLLCLGYPFHPPAKPEQLRTAHLMDLKTPTLIVQGTRDPFGTPDEVAGYPLSKAIELLWLEDGDHDLKPRKTISGFSAADHLKTMADHVLNWSKTLT